MRERIARALMRRSEEQANGAPGVVDYWFTSGDPECAWAVAEYFDLADAVLAALVEPTEAMAKAGFLANRWSNPSPCSPTCVGRVTMPATKAWQAMIDASGIAARSDETPQAAQPEGQEPVPQGDAQNTRSDQ